MFETLSNSRNLALFAGYDFLDLCLLGETGTGKTHTARLIHDLGPRAKKPFVAVNCAELTPLTHEIVESRLNKKHLNIGGSPSSSLGRNSRRAKEWLSILKGYKRIY